MKLLEELWKMNPIIRFWFWITGKRDIPPYPMEFGILNFSQEASERGLKDSQQKIIQHYFYNKFGNLQTKNYLYSEARVHAMEKIKKIPIFNKTEGRDFFPIFGRTLPQELSFTTK